MKQDNEKKSVLNVESHPIPFSKHRSICVKKEKALESILESMKGYRDREFYVTTIDSGLAASINYVDGKFSSMILKGTGEEGERINDTIATTLVPVEARSKRKITLHALLTVQDISRFNGGGVVVTEVPRILRYSLRNGFRPYDNKKIVCRPFKLYVDGVRAAITRVWDVIGDMVVTGYSMEYDYDSAKNSIKREMVVNAGYLLPQCGLVVEDARPDEEGAFHETHFLFDYASITLEGN